MRKNRLIRMLCPFLFLQILIFPLGAQDPPVSRKPTEAKKITIPVQQIIAMVDKALRFPDGLLTGRLTAITKSGATARWDFTMYQSEGQRRDSRRLYQFSSTRRGLEAKLLYRDDGYEIWLWDGPRNQLFRKRDFERYDGILKTGFSYLDLSGYSFQANYNGRQAIMYKTKDDKLYTRLTLVPIISGNYSKLILLADQQANYRPIRIDFHDRSGALFKTLIFQYGEVLLVKSGKSGRLPSPNRLEMLDLKSGMITRLEYFTLDDSLVPGDALFDPDYLNR